MIKHDHFSRRITIFSLTLISLGTTGSSLSFGHIQNKAEEQCQILSESKGLFDQDDILKLTILSDFKSIMNDRGEDRSYHNGLLYYVSTSDDTIFRKVKLRTRGNFRRDPANCTYPPIMVKFGKLKSTDTVFSEQSKLKLVTQCQQENYVLLEYLAYRINNLLTEQSYRVRLAHINYSDLESKEPYFISYAFFIENEKALAQRVNAEIYQSNVVQYFLKRQNTITMALFQYLIGNNDWYVTSKHNISILKLSNSEEIIAVPFDFDWSKLVNAQYTKPSDVPESHLKERRVYKGLCLEEKEYADQVAFFNSKKEDITSLIQSIEDLPRKNKQQSIKYIENFYKLINNRSSLKNIFQNEECIQVPAILK